MAAAAAVNPVTWIVLGVVALIAMIVMLALHWKQVWGGIKDIAKATGAFLVGIWDDIAGEATSIWDSITGTVKGAWQATAAWLTGAWHTVVDPVVGRLGLGRGRHHDRVERHRRVLPQVVAAALRDLLPRDRLVRGDLEPLPHPDHRHRTRGLESGILVLPAARPGR
jgi:hypothetical protein